MTIGDEAEPVFRERLDPDLRSGTTHVRVIILIDEETVLTRRVDEYARVDAAAGFTSTDDRSISDKVERPKSRLCRVGHAYAQVVRRPIVTGDIHEKPGTAAWRRDHIWSPEEARLACPWREGGGESINVVVNLPRAEIRRRSDLDVLAICIGRVGVPFSAMRIEAHTWIGPVPIDDGVGA